MTDKKLENYNFPDELKGLPEDELDTLAAKLRDFLIKNVAVTGGHLASNLGAVELTIALHRVFDFPTDSIIWDVGHQAYTHKILTGKAREFPSLRQYGGLSGFPRASEDNGDIYSSGHSSTAISVAMGLAEARDLHGGDDFVVAVVGDGSMTGGLTFEGLNNVGIRRTRMIVILNDNNMSISRNVGSLSKHLNHLRASSAYLDMKKEIKRKLSGSQGFGEKLLHAMSRVRDYVKHTVIPESIFENLGFGYYGPVDGHDIAGLIDILSRLKNLEEPIILHVGTQKGKGYKIAEDRPELFHGIGPFDVNTGIPLSNRNAVTWSKVCVKELERLATNNERIVTITAAMADGTGLSSFAEKFPNRFYDTGIAESHAVTFAAGLAMKGLRPFVAIYSTFLQRAYDHIVEDIALQNLPVTLLVAHAGIVGEDGETHHGVFDISYLRHVPNMQVIAPSDACTLRAALVYSLSSESAEPAPIAIRYAKGEVVEDIERRGEIDGAGGSGIVVDGGADTGTGSSINLSSNRGGRVESVGTGSSSAPFHQYIMQKGRSRVLKAGRDAIFFSVGSMTEYALAAAEMLAEEGLDIGVIDALFIKPMDEDVVFFAIDKNMPIITVEDNVLAGGFGEAVNSLAASRIMPYKYMSRILNIGWCDAFIPHGSRKKLLEVYGLDANGIANRVHAFLVGDDEDDDDK